MLFMCAEFGEFLSDHIGMWMIYVSCTARRDEIDEGIPKMCVASRLAR